MTDPLVRLRDKAAEDPRKLGELIVESQLGPVSQEAQAVLEKRPEFTPSFLEQQAQKFGLPLDQIQEIAEAVAASGPPGLVVERHQFGLETEAREHLAALYEKEIQRRRTCLRWIYTPVERDGKWRRVRKPCGATFETFDQALVHHSIHLLFEADYRTQRAHWNDVLNIKFPLEQKSLRAALTVDERRRLMADPRFRERFRPVNP
jgi:hypothetical protein